MAGNAIRVMGIATVIGDAAPDCNRGTTPTRLELQRWLRANMVHLLRPASRRSSPPAGSREALGHVTYLWVGMNGSGLSLFRTISGGDGHRALVHELRGNPATAAARERALIEHMKAACRYGNPGWRAERLEEGWTPVDFEVFLDDERRRWHGHGAQRRKV